MTNLLIWRTFIDALTLFKRNFPMYIKGIAVPLVLFLLTYIPMFLHPMAVEPGSPAVPYMGLLGLAQCLLVLWIVNISYRLALTGQAGKMWWSMAETQTLIWLILLGFIITIGAGIPAAVAFFAISFFNKIAAMVVTALIYGLGSYYLLARLVPLFPSIAVGDKKNLKNIWAMTKGHGIRIMLMMILTTIFTMVVIAIVTAIVVMLLGTLEATGHVGLLILSLSYIVLLSIFGTVIALIYKALKGV